MFAVRARPQLLATAGITAPPTRHMSATRTPGVVHERGLGRRDPPRRGREQVVLVELERVTSDREDVSGLDGVPAVLRPAGRGEHEPAAGQRVADVEVGLEHLRAEQPVVLLAVRLWLMPAHG